MTETYGTMLTSIERAARLCGTLAEGRIMMRKAMLDVSNPADISPELHLCVEEDWLDNGRPSYQVAGPLAAALQTTNLNFDSRFVRLPHRSFALELPMEGPGVIRDAVTGRRLKALLVGAIWAGEPNPTGVPGWSYVTRDPNSPLAAWAPDGTRTFRMMVVQSWEDEDNIDPPWMLCTLRLHHVVAEELKITLDQPFREVVNPDGTEALPDGGVRADTQTLDTMLRLAIGASMFAVSANAAFTAPVPEDRQRRRRRERQERRSRTIKLGDELTRRWSLGANIRLPGYEHGGSVGESTSGGQGLQWSHLRQGHLTMRRCGPRDDWHYEMRYIAPVVVKPELGFPPDYQATTHTLDNV